MRLNIGIGERAMIKQGLALVAKQTRLQEHFDYFGRQTFLALLIIMTVAAWLWLGHHLQTMRLTPLSVILLHMVILVMDGTVLNLLYNERYPSAVAIFILGQLVVLTLMIVLARDDSLIPHYMLVIVIAAAVSGPFGVMVTVGLSMLIVVGIGQLMGTSILTTVSHLLLTGLVSANAAMGLYNALVSAENETRRARRHAEEARLHRAEVVQKNKVIEITNQDLQRANMELFYARESANVALQYKREFVARISHELRTSLNLILGFSETIMFSQHIYGSKLPQSYLRDVSEIHRNCRHILDLIDDVLDLARLEAGKMGIRREPHTLNAILSESCEIIAPHATLKGLYLTLDVPETLPTVSLDETRIRQVLLNLLNNAVRVTAVGGIMIRAAIAQDSVIIKIQDTGPGISEEYLPLVFEEFFQGESVAGSAGLGLAVSKQIVELHGGRLWVESMKGEGSLFAFSLPTVPTIVAKEATDHSSVQHPQIQPAVVVVGEPDAEPTTILSRHLSSFSVQIVTDINAAITLAKRTNARAIIVDATSAMNASDVNIPVVRCPFGNNHQATARLGVSALLQKPVTLRQLRTTLERFAPAALEFLVVDSQPGAAHLMERLVKACGKHFQVVKAYSTQEALERIRARRPDAILLDLALSEGDRTGLINMIRQRSAFTDLPIIAVSGQVMEEERLHIPIEIEHPDGFIFPEVLRYLEALLSVVPPAPIERYTTVRPLPTAPSG